MGVRVSTSGSEVSQDDGKFQKPKIPYSEQQLSIIDSEARDIKIMAGAGAGKSSTLDGYARKRPDERMIYLAYNSAIQKDSAGKFPSNVVCRTVNSVAYGAMGVKKRYEDGGAGMTGGLKPVDLIRVFPDATPVEAANAIKVINRFVTVKDMSIINNDQLAIDAGIVPAMRKTAIELATDAWVNMVGMRSKPTIPMTHQGYLKLFQISGKSLGFNNTDYDTILFDEAQDSNPVITDIVLKSKSKKVIVGDKHQSIYAFNGARNALDEMGGLEEFALTTSYRFGQGIADHANIIIKNVLGEGKHFLTGKDCRAFVGDYSMLKRCPGQITKLSRTNAYILDQAVTCIENGTPFHIIGGADSLKLNLVMDVYQLSCGNKHLIKSASIKQYRDFDEFKDYNLNEEGGDIEYKAIAKIVEKYGGKTPDMVESVVKSIKPSASAQIIFSTAHKSKGLEFDSVQIMDDFLSLIEESESDDGIDIQEGNLIYVAMTRAKRNLFLNDDIYAFIQSPKLNPKFCVLNGQIDRTRANHGALENTFQFTKQSNLRSLARDARP